jgi:hypothetical protein
MAGEGYRSRRGTQNATRLPVASSAIKSKIKPALQRAGVVHDTSSESLPAKKRKSYTNKTNTSIPILYKGKRK